MCSYRTLLGLFVSNFILISFTPCSTQELLQDEERGLLLPDFNNYDDASTPDLIRRYGYPAEVYSVTTDDGYILELHRIPHGKNRKADPYKKPVFLQHGLLTCSADWVFNGPNVSLAILLADKGYDVWMGNYRGNTYSRRHIKYSPEKLEFWNFSFHEMGLYDAPASIDFILKKTNQDKVTYIGHSMGTTIFYIMASMRPEYNDKILAQFSLAPIAYLGHTTSPVRLLAPIGDIIYKFGNAFFHGEFLSRSPLLDKALKLFFTLYKGQMIFLQNIIFAIAGKDPDQFKYTVIPKLVGHDPAGISFKALLHYAQFINNPNTFRQFDYGPVENLQLYNSPVPPDYNISAITAKVALFYGQNDLFGNPTDVKLFYPQLPNPFGLIRVNHPAFMHVDFLWAKDVVPLLYNKVFQMMDSLIS
ncbi:hypothetical protein WDU94_013637 [Cyamophila willieti]